MIWQKTGIAIPPVHGLGWAETHAAVPHAESVDDKHVRVYFTTRDGEHRSHIAEARLELEVCRGQPKSSGSRYWGPGHAAPSTTAVS